MTAMKRVARGLCALWVALACVAGLARADDFHVVPFDVDPPIVVDGELADWSAVPNAIEVNRKEQVCYGQETWAGPADLSARVMMAYRYGGLYVAAEVTDDKVVQPLMGSGLWKGDHIEVYMDMVPGVNPTQTMFGNGQFQFGLSPGNLGLNGATTPPEVFIWVPGNASLKGVQVAAVKTDTGYVIEAYVPFASLNVSGVAMNKDANFEIAVSDTDVMPAEQEAMMTVAAKPWQRVRNRLIPMVFGDGNGKAKPPVRAVAIAEKANVAETKAQSFTFAAGPVPEGKDPFIFFKARFHRPRPSGSRANALVVELNGKALPGDRIANRPVRSMMMSGTELTFVAPDGKLRVCYGPGGEAIDRDPSYGLIDNVKAVEYEFNLAGLLKAGENTVTFRSLEQKEANADLSIALEDIAYRVRATVEKDAALKPAPTGPLEVLTPQAAFPKTYSDVRQSAGRIRFLVGGEPMAVTSAFTSPDGKRGFGATPWYTHSRQVIEHDEWIEVRDTFQSLSDQDVPVLQFHECALGDRARDVFLCCMRLPTGKGRESEAENPSAFATTAANGVGLLALNDIFRVHCVETAEAGTVGLSDRSFVLKAGAEYTSELAIVPVTKPDMWRFVNAARRLMDANFTLKHQFAFMFHRSVVYDWSDKLFKSYLDLKSVNFAAQSFYFSRYKGRIPHGFAFAECARDFNYYTDFHKRLRKFYTKDQVKHAIYFHSFLDVMEENAEKYKDARRLDANGEHMNYSGSYPYLLLYVPTLDNAFGRDMAKMIDLRFDACDADGIYWDEFNQSRGKYTYTPGMWDGCSGDVDQKTFRLVRKKAAVHLMSRDWLAAQVKKILARGPLVCNGAPMSRTIANLKVQNFIETGSVTHCHSTILHSPVALGDHLTERSEKDAYDVMLRALDWGCLYNWYSTREVIPTYKTLTEHMFPFTPIELHSGWVVGKERILTKVSGRFGWGDASDFNLYVYDRIGKITTGEEAKKVTQDGKTYADIRIPEGYSAAIVRVVK